MNFLSFFDVFQENLWKFSWEYFLKIPTPLSVAHIKPMFHFYTPWKHQKGYRNEDIGLNWIKNFFQD